MHTLGIGIAIAHATIPIKSSKTANENENAQVSWNLGGREGGNLAGAEGLRTKKVKARRTGTGTQRNATGRGVEESRKTGWGWDRMGYEGRAARYKVTHYLPTIPTKTSKC